MKEPVVRLGEKDDLPSILFLIKELAFFEKMPEQVKMDLVTLQRDFDSSAFEFLVAEEESIIGTAIFYPKYSTWNGRRLYLEDLIVTDAARNKGVGELLMNALKELCSQRDYSAIEWQVLDWNVNALRFYERLGATVDRQWWDCTLEIN